MLRDYFNDKAAVWDEMVAEHDSDKLNWMASLLDIKPGSTVLDVGTGTGVFVPFILSRIGEKGRLVCLDLAEQMLKRCKAKGFKGNIEYICADISDSGLVDQTFDAVICYSSFPHFQNKPKALSEIYRVLRIGGKLFICHTSSRCTINEIHYQIQEVHDDLIPEDDEMRRLLSEAGFAEIGICDGDDKYLSSAKKA